MNTLHDQNAEKDMKNSVFDLKQYTRIKDTECYYQCFSSEKGLVIFLMSYKYATETIYRSIILKQSQFQIKFI